LKNEKKVAIKKRGNNKVLFLFVFNLGTIECGFTIMCFETIPFKAKKIKKVTKSSLNVIKVNF
jgi:hypothetical protein